MGAQSESFLSCLLSVLVNEDHNVPMPLFFLLVAVDEQVARLSLFEGYFLEGAILMDAGHELGPEIALVGEAYFAKELPSVV